MLLSKKRRYNSSDVFLNESYGENKPIWDKYILKTQINGDDCYICRACMLNKLMDVGWRSAQQAMNHLSENHLLNAL